MSCQCNFLQRQQTIFQISPFPWKFADRISKLAKQEKSRENGDVRFQKCPLSTSKAEGLEEISPWEAVCIDSPRPASGIRMAKVEHSSDTQRRKGQRYLSKKAVASDVLF